MARWRSIEGWVEPACEGGGADVTAFGAAARVACLRVDLWLIEHEVVTRWRDHRWAIMAGRPGRAVPVAPDPQEEAQNWLHVEFVPPGFAALPVGTQRQEVIARLMMLVRGILGPDAGERASEVETAIRAEPWSVTLEAASGRLPGVGPCRVVFTVAADGALTGQIQPSSGEPLPLDVPTYLAADIVTLRAVGRSVFAQARDAQRRARAAKPAAPGSVADRVRRAGDEQTPTDELAQLAADSSPAVRNAAAGNRATPAEALTRLASDSRKSTRLAVAENPSAPDEALLALVGDTYNQIRWALPLRPLLSPELQHALATAEDPMTRENLAGNRSLNAHTARLLAADPKPNVRGRIAAFTTEPDLLAELAVDPHPEVRAGAAENPRLTQEQRQTLQNDPRRRVRDAYTWLRET